MSAGAGEAYAQQQQQQQQQGGEPRDGPGQNVQPAASASMGPWGGSACSWLPAPSIIITTGHIGGTAHACFETQGRQYLAAAAAAPRHVLPSAAPEAAAGRALPEAVQPHVVSFTAPAVARHSGSVAERLAAVSPAAPLAGTSTATVSATLPHPATTEAGEAAPAGAPMPDAPAATHALARQLCNMLGIPIPAGVACEAAANSALLRSLLEALSSDGAGGA